MILKAHVAAPNRTAIMALATGTSGHSESIQVMSNKTMRKLTASLVGTGLALLILSSVFSTARADDGLWLWNQLPKLSRRSNRRNWWCRRLRYAGGDGRNRRCARAKNVPWTSSKD